jgi:hypothetical protein
MEESSMPMKNAIWRKCNGEAHSNPHIDHCGVCMPWWGVYPLCPYCGTALRRGGTSKARCKHCNKFFTLNREEEVKPAWPNVPSFLEGDGREKIEPEEINVVKGTRPMAVTRHMAVDIVSHFERSGNSTHSIMGSTMWVIVKYCRERSIPYSISTSNAGGYFLQKEVR